MFEMALMCMLKNINDKKIIMEKFLSIVIPFFNAKKDDIRRCLDSIYSQGLRQEEFEVIVVNDCSTDNQSVEFLNSYKDTPPIGNLLIINHEENKRQGGARNTGVKHAKGDYIQFIDQDDYFAGDALTKLVQHIKSDNRIDIYMMDNLDYDISKKKSVGPFYAKYQSKTYVGTDFMVEFPVPWVPWLYCYRRLFLLENELEFEEKVRFEDVDYVMKATMSAKSIVYYPEVKIIHTISSEQTSNIGSDLLRITDLLALWHRVRLLGESYLDENEKCANAIIGHQQFAYNDFIKRIFWRLNPTDFLMLMKQYPAKIPSKFRLLNFVAKHPKMFIYTCSSVRPVLYGIRNIVVKLR